MFENDSLFRFLEQQEGIMVGIIGNEIKVFISYYEHGPEEVEAFKKDPVQFGVGFGLGALVFAHKIGNCGWQDSVYSYHYAQFLHNQGQGLFIEPSIEDLKEGEALPVTRYLIDSETAEVVAKRSFHLPEELKNEVIMGLKEQKYSKIPILNTLDSSSKIQAFEFVRNFFECQPIEHIVEGIKKCTFNY